MAVLIEAISLVVRRARIDSKYPGGWPAFVADCPNQTLCADDELARVGFMTPDDARAFCDRLAVRELVYLRDGRAIDFALVDQLGGPTTECDWLEYGHVAIDGHRVAAARLVGSSTIHLVTPELWQFEGSLSENPGFVPSEDVESRLEFTGCEDGVEVWRDKQTGNAMYLGRPSGRANNQRAEPPAQ